MSEVEYTQCVKAGAHVFLECYDKWFICDAFMTPGETLVLKGAAIQMQPTPLRDVKHYTVETFQDKWSIGHMVVFLSDVGSYHDHGYDGVSVQQPMST